MPGPVHPSHKVVGITAIFSPESSDDARAENNDIAFLVEVAPSST
jgi:hypothetical protein